MENHPESLINEVILLTSIDDSSVKLTRNGESNNLYLLFLSGSTPTAEVVKWEPHSLRVSTHNAMTCKYGYCDLDDATTKSK